MAQDLLRPNSTCAKCGRLFFCGSEAEACWCDGLTLSDHQRRTLAAMKLEGCLCPDCLEAL